MKILIYCPNYFPELTSTGKYTGEMGEWLAAKGHDVRVVAAPPYYPEWTIKEGYSGYSYKYEELKGVKIWRSPIWVPKKPSGLKRLLHLASFAISSFPIMVRQVFWKPDIVIIIEPPLFGAPAALLTARLSGAKAWLHIQDFEVDAAFELGLLSNKFLRSFITTIEKWLMKQFDTISTISDRMFDILLKKGLPESKCILFPNWVNTDLIYPDHSENQLKQELKISNEKFIVLYSGNMGEKQGLDVVIESAKLLEPKSEILFVMCGGGAAYENLRELAKGSKNILWLPVQPLEKLNELLNMANLHILPQRAGIIDLVMPSKLSGILASGRPVVAMAYPNSQVAQVVQDCGIVVESGNAEVFAKAITQIYENPQKSEQYSIKAREYAVLNLSHDSILNNFEQKLLSYRRIKKI